MLALHSLVEQAAREAGVVAYWVGASNLSGDEKELESDVSEMPTIDFSIPPCLSRHPIFDSPLPVVCYKHADSE